MDLISNKSGMQARDTTQAVLEHTCHPGKFELVPSWSVISPAAPALRILDNSICAVVLDWPAHRKDQVFESWYATSQDHCAKVSQAQWLAQQKSVLS